MWSGDSTRPGLEPEPSRCWQSCGRPVCQGGKSCTLRGQMAAASREQRRTRSVLGMLTDLHASREIITATSSVRSDHPSRIALDPRLMPSLSSPTRPSASRWSRGRQRRRGNQHEQRVQRRLGVVGHRQGRPDLHSCQGAKKGTRKRGQCQTLGRRIGGSQRPFPPPPPTSARHISARGRVGRAWVQPRAHSPCFLEDRVRLETREPSSVGATVVILRATNGRLDASVGGGRARGA